MAQGSPKGYVTFNLFKRYEENVNTQAIVKFHELALKGKNRPIFIRRLVENLRVCLKDTDVQKVWKGHMFIGLTLPENADWETISNRIKDCLGVAKFYRATTVALNLSHVKTFLDSALKNMSFYSFRITAHRTDKRFPIDSRSINQELGAYVQKISGARVNLSEPDLEIFVDVMSKDILVYFNEIKGYGGLPVGISGKVMTLLSGGIDSPVASWHLMKRGGINDFIHFHSHPLVDTSTKEKAVELTQLLTRFQYSSTLYLVPFSSVQQHIIVSTPPSYRVILYRRFMIRIAEELAKRKGVEVLVTGESLGQVASQTLRNITLIDEISTIPIFRPLIGMNKEEIVGIARNLGTFDISTIPDQDCCTLFVPKHPQTRGHIGVVRSLEALLPVQQMINEALAGMEEKHFSFLND